MSSLRSNILLLKNYYKLPDKKKNLLEKFGSQSTIDQIQNNNNQ